MVVVWVVAGYRTGHHHHLHSLEDTGFRKLADDVLEGIYSHNHLRLDGIHHLHHHHHLLPRLLDNHLQVCHCHYFHPRLHRLFKLTYQKVNRQNDDLRIKFS